jgi:hypothetical protein
MAASDDNTLSVLQLLLAGHRKRNLNSDVYSFTGAICCFSIDECGMVKPFMREVHDAERFSSMAIADRTLAHLSKYRYASLGSHVANLVLAMLPSLRPGSEPLRSSTRSSQMMRRKRSTSTTANPLRSTNC